MSDKKNIDVDELALYFAGQERNRIDRGSSARRTARVLALRDRLLALPEKDFDATIKTLENLLAAGTAGAQDGNQRGPSARDTLEVFRGSGSGSGTKVDPV